MPEPIVKPANQVVLGGTPLRREVEIGANAIVAEMLPGRLVIHDVTDGHVKEAGVKARNVLGFLDVASDKKESDNYAVGDRAMLVEGECYAKLTLLAGEIVSPGDMLVAAANGKVAKQAVGAMGSQGQVIGQALESSNITVDAEIAVHFKLGSEPAAAS